MNMDDIKLNPEEIANQDELTLFQDLECGIDMVIPLNPYMCSKCQNVFCRDCALQCKQKYQQCPMRCPKPFELIAVDNLIVKDQIKKIRLFCQYKTFGCKVTPLFIEKDEHEKVCEFKPIKCPICAMEVSRSKLINHYFRSCQKFVVKCPNCEKNCSFSEFAKHIEICEKDFMHCEYCFKKVKIIKSDFENNFNNCNNLAGYGSRQHLDKCEMNVSVCKVCELPEFSKLLSTTHQHERNIEEYDIMGKYLFSLQI